MAPESTRSAGSALVTSGHNPGPPPCTPSMVDTRFCYKVPSYCKVSSGLKSGGSCESGKVLETHHTLKKKERRRKKKNDVLPMLPSCKLREGDLKSCRHEVLKAQKNKWRRTGKHSRSRKTPAIWQLSYHMHKAVFQTTLL